MMPLAATIGQGTLDAVSLRSLMSVWTEFGCCQGYLHRIEIAWHVDTQNNVGKDALFATVQLDEQAISETCSRKVLQI